MSDKRRENFVQFRGILEREPRVFQKEEVQVHLFLKGNTERGTLYMPVKVKGEVAERLSQKGETWKTGDEIYVEGELDWDSYEKNGEKRYQTIIVAQKIQKIEEV